MAPKKRASEKDKGKKQEEGEPGEPKAKSAKTRAPKASMSRCKKIPDAVIEVSPPDPISKAKIPSKQSNLMGHVQIKPKEQTPNPAQSLRSDNEQKDQDTGRVGRR